jgi:hypothetical protein
MRKSLSEFDDEDNDSWRPGLPRFSFFLLGKQAQEKSSGLFYRFYFWEGGGGLVMNGGCKKKNSWHRKIGLIIL